MSFEEFVSELPLEVERLLLLQQIFPRLLFSFEELRDITNFYYFSGYYNTVAKRETSKCWTGTHIYLFLLKYCSLFLKLSPCMYVFRIEISFLLSK